MTWHSFFGRLSSFSSPRDAPPTRIRIQTENLALKHRISKPHDYDPAQHRETERAGRTPAQNFILARPKHEAMSAGLDGRALIVAVDTTAVRAADLGVVALPRTSG